MATIALEEFRNRLSHIDTIETLLACLQTDVNFDKTEIYEATPSIADYRYLSSAKKQYPVTMPEYHQIFADKHGFIPNLSVLDLLFHEGPNTGDYLTKVIL